MNIGETKQGRRGPDNAEWPDIHEGDYGKHSTGLWYVFPPGGVYTHIDPKTWTITEHEDRTATVSPSILQHPNHENPSGWHGFLERGIWRRV